MLLSQRHEFEEFLERSFTKLIITTVDNLSKQQGTGFYYYWDKQVKPYKTWKKVCSGCSNLYTDTLYFKEVGWLLQRSPHCCISVLLWHSRIQLRKKYLINRLRQELEKLYVDQWENKRQNMIRKHQKSKLELYSNIKSSYRRETYIDDVRDVQTRKCITQIRLSAHKFPIEHGRYKNIPREQRMRNLCCNNLVGDEFHYLFICNEFSLTQRKQTFINAILKVNTHFINPRSLLEKIVTRRLEGGGSIGPPPLLLSTQFVRLT